MFPECYFNCFNPYYRESMMNYNSYVDLPEGVSRQQQPLQQEPQVQQPQTPQQPDFEQAPGSPLIQDTLYTQGYLRTQIGKRVKIFFLIGTNIVQDREGVLTDVGISFIILKEIDTNYKILCDIYSIKFVTIYP